MTCLAAAGRLNAECDARTMRRMSTLVPDGSGCRRVSRLFRQQRPSDFRKEHSVSLDTFLILLCTYKSVV